MHEEIFIFRYLTIHDVEIFLQYWSHLCPDNCINDINNLFAYRHFCAHVINETLANISKLTMSTHHTVLAYDHISQQRVGEYIEIVGFFYAKVCFILKRKINATVCYHG